MTTLDEIDDRCIAVPYDPDQVAGEWGWLWMGKAQIDDWVLVRTIEDDGDFSIEAWEPEGTPYLPSFHEAADWRGARRAAAEMVQQVGKVLSADVLMEMANG